MTKQMKSNIALLTAAIIWGFAFTTQCMVDTSILGTLSFNGIRYVLGGICLIPVALLLEKEVRNLAKFKKTILYGVITGFVLFLASTSQMYGIAMVKNAGKSGFLTGLYIVIVPFYGSILYKKKGSYARMDCCNYCDNRNVFFERYKWLWKCHYGRYYANCRSIILGNAYNLC